MNELIGDSGDSIVQLYTSFITIYVALWALHWSGRITDPDVRTFSKLHRILFVVFAVVIILFINIPLTMKAVHGFVMLIMTCASIIINKNIQRYRDPNKEEIEKFYEIVSPVQGNLQLELNNILLSIASFTDKPSVDRKIEFTYNSIVNVHLPQSMGLTDQFPFNVSIFIWEPDGHYKIRAHFGVSEEHQKEILDRFRWIDNDENKDRKNLAMLAMRRKRLVKISRATKFTDPEALEYFSTLSGEKTVHHTIYSQPLILGDDASKESIAFGALNLTMQEENTSLEEEAIQAILLNFAHYIEGLYCWFVKHIGQYGAVRTLSGLGTSVDALACG